MYVLLLIIAERELIVLSRGEPVDKNLWGELEPEEGGSHLITLSYNLNHALQRTKNQKRRQNQLLQMACKCLQVLLYHLE